MDRKSYSPAAFLERFVALEVRAAGLIFGAAVLGVMLATFGDYYVHNSFTELISEIAIGGFFLLVGLELRREFASGTLSGSTLKVALAATLGGMALPALIFVSFAPESARNGWVAVVATDIALASAVTALGGFRRELRALLLTVAVLDDLGGVLALATTGKSPKLLFIGAVVLVVAFFAWSIRKFNFGVMYTLATTALVVWLMLQAGMHPSLGAFAVGFVVPHFDPDNHSVAERTEEAIHPYVAAIFLPAFVFLHTLIPVRIPDGAPANLIVITIAAIVLGKTLGIGAVLALTRKMSKISIFEALAVGFAAAAALTVALIGVDATLADSIYEQVVGLGVLGATAIAVVLGIVAGRLAKAERRELA
ncbi:Na(+)/H(+) antiporter NhaA [Actinomycetes bacterium]|nr:Na(+)/H(+) antiporter NhaA [Actinomycetes bacterium]